MPLPPAPSKRAALLEPQAFDAPARASAKAARKPLEHSGGHPVAEKTLAFDLLDRRKVSTSEAWAHLAVVGDEVYVRDLQGLSVFHWKK